MFLVSRPNVRAGVRERPPDQGRVTEMRSLALNHQPTKFGSHSLCGRVEIRFLVFLVTSSDHVIKQSFDLAYEIHSS